MAEISVFDYLTHLRQKRVYSNKQMKFLSHIVIYTNNLKVYKVIVFADTNKKNGRRYGVNEPIVIYTKNMNSKNIDFPQLKNELAGSEKDTKMFIYYFKTAEMNVYDGENLTVPT